MATENFRKNIGKRTGQAGWEAEQGGGMVFSPKFTTGDYDHRKSERGQTAWGGGGHRGRPDAQEQVLDIAPIGERLATFVDNTSSQSGRSASAGKRGPLAFLRRLFDRD